MKNKVSGLLMETGIVYNKQKLHQKKYFSQLLVEQRPEMPESLPELLQLSRTAMDTLTAMDRQLLKALEQDPVLATRVERLMTIPAVGPVLALTWALEVGDVRRFASLRARSVIAGCVGPSIARLANNSEPLFQKTATSICRQCWSRRRNWRRAGTQSSP